MKKWIPFLCSVIFFLPAVINTLVILWIFVYPWLNQPQYIQMPWQVLPVLSLFWISGILLSRGDWYGGIPSGLLPLYAYMESLSGYAGMSHINWFPIAAVTVCYYAFCGLLAHWLKKQVVHSGE